MKNKFIVLEGVDGSGKSEVGRIVSKKLFALNIESPLPEFNLIRKYIDENSSPIGRFLFYLSTNLDLSRVIDIKTSSRDVVCTRYYYSTLIGYAARTRSNLDNLIKSIPISDEDFYQPDMTILLYVNRFEQKKRINKRNKGINSGSDELCLYNEDYGINLAEKYLETARNKKWVVIDTSHLTIDEVVQECLSNIKDYYKKIEQLTKRYN